VQSGIKNLAADHNKEKQAGEALAKHQLAIAAAAS
jgi:hypothetical protein